MIASVRSGATSGAIRHRVVSSSDRGPSIRQYCFGMGAPAIKLVRLCNRVPSPPARTSAQRDSLVRSVIPVWRRGSAHRDTCARSFVVLLFTEWSPRSWSQRFALGRDTGGRSRDRTLSGVVGGRNEPAHCELTACVNRWFYRFELAGDYRRYLGTEEEIEMTATHHFDVLEVRCPGNLQ